MTFHRNEKAELYNKPDWTLFGFANSYDVSKSGNFAILPEPAWYYEDRTDLFFELCHGFWPFSCPPSTVHNKTSRGGGNMPPYMPEYAPEQYERIPYRFARLMLQFRSDEAANIVIARAKHLTTFSRKQGQQEVRNYAKRITLIASLLRCPDQCRVYVCPGQVDIQFDLNPFETYSIYTTYRRKHRKRVEA